ncbi:MAG: tRNA (adenosine(37)-N6)-threonylcarbamoyltransferase complex dimerization subunit type 1 TsaB [Prolixibacteraceae bacterium]
MSSTILCIETSTEICSVVLAKGGEVVDRLEDANGMNHSRLLTQFIDELLNRNDLKAADLAAVAVSEGPGSYTGLRIGVSAAKGICFAVNKPLIAISPLHSMADAVIRNQKELNLKLEVTDLLVPMIDARRMEVYRAIYSSKGELLENTDAVIVDETTFSALLELGRVLFFGNGAEKLKPVIQHPNALFIDGIVTSASHMASIANLMFENEQFVDVAYFEPFYLKDFIAIKSTKKMF